MKGRLFLKIFATYLILILLVVAVLDFLHTPQIRNTLSRSVQDKMMGHGKIIALMPQAEIRNRIRELAALSDARLTLIDLSGWVKADSEANIKDLDNHLNRSEVQEARLKGQGSAVRYSRTLREDMLYVALPLKDNSRIKGYVRLSRPLRDVRESIEEVYRYLYLTLFVIAVPAILLAFFFARGITSPIRRMTEFTAKILSGESPGALVLDSPDEMGQLAGAMNQILQEQQEKIRLAKKEASKLEAAFSSMEEGILILDGENHIESCNRSLGQMLGKKPEDIIGRTPLEIFRSIPLQDALDRFRKSGISALDEVTLDESQFVAVTVHIADIQGLPDQEKKTIMVFHDVTRLKKLERMRSDFITNVTHELKTPLTAIIGYVETLQDGAKDDPLAADKFLQIIHDHARRLDRLVNDLLTLSALEQGEEPLEMSALSPGQIISDILPIIQEQADKKGLPFVVELPENLPLIRADKDKTAQILLNILDNAVKFTSLGHIAVQASAADKDGFLCIRISDTGQGIPKSEIPRLGERFYRVDRTRSRELGGTGLGLSIVKHLMIAHQGWMEIESREGKGTTVSLFFPIADDPA